MPELGPSQPEPTPPTATPQPPKKAINAAGITAPNKRKKIIMIGSAVIVLLMIAIGAYALTRPDTGSSVTQSNPPQTITLNSPTPTPTPANLPSTLDGVIVPSEKANLHPLAIMIENHPDSRPQAGLTDAGIVYEAITEGGITRFMALYTHTLPPKAGPVRSARQVYVDFVKEFTPNSAYYAHVGGSAIALGKIKSEGVYDLDQGGIGTKAFQRFPRAGIATEHTMFTFPEKLLQVVKDRGYKSEATHTSWKFKDDAAVIERPESQTITIPFSSASYQVKYLYDKTNNNYKRYLAGIEHKDANNGKTITPKNIIVQFANYKPVQSATKVVQDVSIIGEGTGKLYRDGRAFDITWKKANGNARTMYTETATGKEVELVRGQTWVEVPEIGTNVTVQ